MTQCFRKPWSGPFHPLRLKVSQAKHLLCLCFLSPINTIGTSGFTLPSLRGWSAKWGRGVTYQKKKWPEPRRALRISSGFATNAQCQVK